SSRGAAGACPGPAAGAVGKRSTTRRWPRPWSGFRLKRLAVTGPLKWRVRREAVPSPSTAWPRINGWSVGRTRSRALARLSAETGSRTRRSAPSPGADSTRNGRLASVSSTRRTRSGQWPRRTARTASEGADVAVAAAGGRIKARIIPSARAALRDPLVRPQAGVEHRSIHHRVQCQGLPGGQESGPAGYGRVPLAPGREVVVAYLAKVLAVVAAEGEGGDLGVAGAVVAGTEAHAAGVGEAGAPGQFGACRPRCRGHEDGQAHAHRHAQALETLRQGRW